MREWSEDSNRPQSSSQVNSELSITQLTAKHPGEATRGAAGPREGACIAQADAFSTEQSLASLQRPPATKPLPIMLRASQTLPLQNTSELLWECCSL